MSWFSEMAGKAESFLNNLDQVAASAITKSSDESQSDLASSTGSTATIQPSLVTHQPKYSASAAAATKPVSHSRTSSVSSSFSTVSSRNVHGDNSYGSSHNLYGVNYSNPYGNTSSVNMSDDKIFEYLNSTEDSARSSTPLASLSRSSSKLPPRKLSDDDTSNASIEVVSNPSRQDSGGKVTPVSPPNEELINESINEPLVYASSQPDKKQQFVVMEEEMKSLTAEISRLNKRTVELETLNKRLNKRIENWKSQVQSSDQAVREANEREALSKQLIAERDGIIISLESQLQNMNRDRLEILNKIDSLEKERKILMSERESSVEETIKSIQEYKETISKLSEELNNEKEMKNRIQSELMARIQSLEEDQKELINDLSSIKSESKSDKIARKELTRKVNQLESSLSELRIEYDNYKEKATKTLTSKDELIAQLQRGSEMGDEGIADTNDYQLENSDNRTLVLQHEVDTLKSEVKELQSKLDTAEDEVDAKKSEFESLERKYNEVNERLSTLNEQLMNEKRNKDGLYQDYIQLQEEYKYVKDEGKKLREGLNQRLSDKEVEIDKLRKQLTSKQSTQNLQLLGSSSSSPNSVHELESRIKSLTENLIQKQAMVEQLNADRNSLTLQLERCESRLRSYQDGPSSPGMCIKLFVTFLHFLSQFVGSVTIGMIHSSSASNLVNRYRPLMEESVQDGQVTRKVKRAYTQLDHFR